MQDTRALDNREPLVTVIIPTFNRKEWIGECLDSVLGQTYPNLEIIVVDDGSSDGTANWIAAKPEYESVIVHVQENSGASTARNNGIKLATGELITFIDSDDMLLPKHVATAVEVFEKYPDLGLFCCDSTMIDPEGNVILDGKTWHQNLSDAKNLNIRTGFRSLEDVFSFSNCFPGFTLRRDVFEKLGGFEQSIFPADDYDLALRVAGSEYKVFYLHEPLCLRREHDGQCSGIVNSVKTQVKLIEALENTVKREPEKFKAPTTVRNRLAEIRLEMGISEIKEGSRRKGVRTMIRAIAERPSQVTRLARIGGRKLKNAVGR